MVCLGNICLNTLHKGDNDNDNNNLVNINIRFFYDMKLILLIESGKEGMEATRALLKENAIHRPNITHQSTYPESRFTQPYGKSRYVETGSLFLCI
jgi:hypothetical protein